MNIALAAAASAWGEDEQACERLDLAAARDALWIIAHVIEKLRGATSHLPSCQCPLKRVIL